MRSLITKFIKDDAGAVTVDFVVLTAAALSFTLGVYKWFIIDPDNSEMGMAIIRGEVADLILTSDNGLTKMVAKARFHAFGFVSCIFGQSPDVSHIRGSELAEDGAVCRYILG